MRTMTEEPRSFEEFWPHYVGEHRKPLCRLIHYVGGVAALGMIGYSLATGRLMLLLLVPVLGYGFAWTAHFWIEHNRPATWGYVLWSARGEFKMLWLGITGQMGREVERLFGSTDPDPDAPLLVRK